MFSCFTLPSTISKPNTVNPRCKRKQISQSHCEREKNNQNQLCCTYYSFLFKTIFSSSVIVNKRENDRRWNGGKGLPCLLLICSSNEVVTTQPHKTGRSYLKNQWISVITASSHARDYNIGTGWKAACRFLTQPLAVLVSSHPAQHILNPIQTHTNVEAIIDVLTLGANTWARMSSAHDSAFLTTRSCWLRLGDDPALPEADDDPAEPLHACFIEIAKDSS